MKNNSVIFLSALLVIFSVYNISCTADKLPLPSAGEECNDFNATYDGDIKPIIETSCALVGCHVTGGGAPGIFENYEGLADFTNDGPNGLRDRVIVLVDDPDNGMPPNIDTNPGPNDLTDEQFQIFKCWIDSGYPEN